MAFAIRSVTGFTAIVNDQFNTADQAQRELAARADVAATYDANCKSCHGVAGLGSTVARPMAGLPAPEVKKAITEGKGNMKPVLLANADDLATYVAGLKNSSGWASASS